MKTAYTLLVVLDVDEELDEPGREWRELTAQLRLAAHEIVTGGAPEPGESRRITPGAGQANADAPVITYLSAVEL